MRNNNLKDLYVDYPFLPVETAPSWFKAVKYMRITVVLPAWQPASMGYNGEFITATLTALTPEKATVRIQCAPYSYDEELDIAVFTGVIPHGNSYLYTDTELPTLSGLSYQIHPDCLVFQQIAPALLLEIHSGSSNPAMQLERADDGAIRQWLLADDIERYAVDDILWLENGHNIDVSGSSDTILFTGAPDAGKGVWSEPPYSTADSSFDGYRGKGLRSINGKSGDVLIQYGRSVDLRIEGTTIHIGPANDAYGAQA